MLTHAPLTVDGIRKLREEKQKEIARTSQILHDGYRTEFWALIRSEMQARRDSLVKKLIGEEITASDINNVLLIQAEIRILDVLLAQENAVPGEVVAPKPSM